ncbi:unnamed protein product [Owenia fusiformis]|uniref:Uncharacterized protein n=1 Tax=Owenia fusiformis TaxID=6347 RepID=A0A8J1T7F6_OWEFU|nr:unnamed protein product [Owenia fusiformis]
MGKFKVMGLITLVGIICWATPCVGLCPKECICQGNSVDCSFRGLKMVPRDITKTTERLDLQGNNITIIRRGDFNGLKRLRILQLLDNQIETIEKGAFQDLTAMERLRLNRNKLAYIPDLLFANMGKLYRLDLSYNKLKVITRKTIKGAPLLKNLQVDNNQISCIAGAAIRGLKDMEIITFNKNNITTLASDMFDSMHKLRVTRLADNALNCDCHLSWLAKWLRSHPKLGLFTKCGVPHHLKSANVAELRDNDFKCNDVEVPDQDDCYAEPICPAKCVCSESIVDCRDKGLTDIPDNIPELTTELRLEQNQITRVSSKAFMEYKRLRRIDLSNNMISFLAPDAFVGLKSLNSLVLYGNKITDLPPGIFKGMTSLQLLLLNANKISCVRTDTFEDLSHLNLLSLYDNKIQSLANGSFTPLKNIQTLHLARNPFICDCNLRWLSEYLHTHPIETSGARCDTPRRMQRKKIGHIRDSKFKCGEEHRTKHAGECMVDRDCPKMCICEGTTVDCSGRRLTKIPEDLPSYTTDLKLMDNFITTVPNGGIFKRVPHLQKVDFRNNKIDSIADGAFEGADVLSDLQLTENKLHFLNGGMFKGLKSLRTLMLRSNKISCVTNTTFTDLNSMRLLSLYDNQIRCIQPGSFDRLQYLSTLNLLSNPFNCNCNLGWLSNWLQKRNIVTGNPRCAVPSLLKDMAIQELKPTDFKCEKLGENSVACHSGAPLCCTKAGLGEYEKSCDPRAYCPAKCQCTGTVVRCSRQSLAEIPADIPLDTTELYLDVNQIKEIPPYLARLTKLTWIDLSHNSLMSLPDYAFANLSSLSTLILSYNKLQCITKTSFAGLKKLRLLSLHENDISTMPYGSYDDLTSLTHIALGDNPLYCDCNLKWLSDWVRMKKDYIEPGIAKCAGPDEMKHQLILTTLPDKFLCKENPDPAIQSKCDICYTKPCKNGGKCMLHSYNNYTCQCIDGYHGNNCQNEIDACYGNPCENGGKCNIIENGRFSCQCLAGFEGYRCEVNIDDCKSHMCLNNATCIDQVETYSCKCRKGFAGAFCEKKIKFCSDFNPCQNEAECVDLETDYMCVCPEGITGRNCSISANDCINNLCQNGATCVDKRNMYICKCPRGFSGHYCEIEPEPSSDTQYDTTQACEFHDCKNGGKCYVPHHSNEYACKCTPGFEGKKCEKLISISFQHIDSYARLPALDNVPDANVTIRLATMKENGIIMYWGAESHVAVELFHGRVRISYDVGNYPVSTMFSFEKVNNGKFHTLELLMIKQNFTLRIDGHQPRTILNEGKKDYLVSEQMMFLGGLPTAIKSNAFSKWHIRDDSSFNGCFKQVIINGKLMDFSPLDTHHRLMPGCPVMEKPEPCEKNKCEFGKCRPLKDPSPGSTYRCDCRKGYTGTFCEIEPTCRGIEYREIYIDPKTGCKSRSKVKHRKCEGTCGKYCCKPKKIKTRKVRLFCGDGTNYIHSMPIIRKCGCRSCTG